MKKLALFLLAAVALTLFAAAEPLLISPAPAPVTVVVNGEAVNFPDALPEIVNDRTMVPFRAAAEAMGFKVDYDDATAAVYAEKDGKKLFFTLGKPEMTVVENGGTTTKTLDVIPYEKYDRTYVPVRFFAEEMGMNVDWNGAQETAVIYDADLLAASLDKHYTTVNALLADSFEKSLERKPMEGKMDIGFTLTAVLPDSSAKIEFPFTFSADYLTEGLTAELHGTMDISAFKALMTLQGGEENAENLDALLGASGVDLAAVDYDLILNAETGTLYLHSEDIGALVNALAAADPDSAAALEEAGVDFSGWLKFDYADMMASLPQTAGVPDAAYLSAQAVDPTKLDPADYTVGKLFTAFGKLLAGSDTDSYTVITEADKVVEKILGDKAFVAKDGVFNATVTLADLLGAMDADLPELADSDFRFDLVIDTEKKESAVDIHLKYIADTTLKLDLTAEEGETRSSVSMDLRTGNEMNTATLTVTAAENVTAKTPAKAPADGEKVVDANALMASANTAAE